ncbi:hypothetical protein FRX31_003450 [Thalictrum thalictroides]|uniref:DUF4283 domain-containing protein n=1 Tax=Thalictrum thalictroides TaxID=46969 RepID=A0A7J6XBU3_THATH|nr:hypothetical protein FRX31_003450 [Thalictrum thalictroides]
MVGEQIKESFSVEGKTFIVVWNRSIQRGETLAVTDNRGGRSFFAVFSSEGGRWVGKLLCQISMGTTKVGTIFRFPESNGSIAGILKENQRGQYIQVTIHSRSSPREFATICFPTGLNGEGWSFLGEKIRTLLDTREGTKRVYRPVVPNAFNQGSSPSFVDMCKQIGATAGNDGLRVSAVKCNGGGENTLPLLGDGNPSEISRFMIKWGLVVLCRATGLSPDWHWCEEKVKTVFKSASFSRINGDEALIFLDSFNEVEKLVSLPPLESWNGIFRFQKWHKEAGSNIQFRVEQRKHSLQVVLHGLPYHLRTHMVMKMIANTWGDKDIKEVTNGLEEKNWCGFVIDSGDFAKIPRLVTVEENDLKFSVRIQVSLMEGGEKFDQLTPNRVIGCGGSFFPDKAGVVQRVVMPQKTGCSSSSNPSQPPGFELCGPHVSPLVQNRFPALENHESFKHVQENRFAILGEDMDLMESNDSLMDRPKHKEGPELIPDDEEDHLQPVGQFVRRRKHRSISMKRGHQVLGFGPRNQLIREGLVRMEKQRGRSRTRENVRLAVRNHQVQNPPLPSSSVEVSRVCESYSANSDSERTNNRNEDKIREVVISLRRASNEDDLRNLINWIVIPLAEDLGLSSSLGRVG